MSLYRFLWTNEIVEHLGEHGISQDDFEHVLRYPASKGVSRATGLPVVWGYTPDGRYIFAVYERLDELTVLPVTAYEVSEPR